jgi:hypothetical protein
VSGIVKKGVGSKLAKFLINATAVLIAAYFLYSFAVAFHSKWSPITWRRVAPQLCVLLVVYLLAWWFSTVDRETHFRCDICRNPNSVGSRYCGACGSELPAVKSRYGAFVKRARLGPNCQACGFQNQIGSKFCGNCGGKIR